jgi:hypothetical protein
MRRLAAIVLSVALAAGPVPALDLHLRDSFHFPRVASLEWDPALCGLWVATEGPRLFLLTPAGREIRRIEPGLRVVRALTVEADGLLVADGWGGFQRITRDGEPRGRRFELAPHLRDVEGLQREPGGTFLVVEDDPARLLRLGPDGSTRMERSGASFAPRLEEMQGVARDPLTGHILVVDDNEGLNALVEMTADGAILSVTPLSEWGYDAEAVAVHAQTGTLFIGFDSGQRIAVFDYLPTRPEAGFVAFDQGPDCPVS